MTNTLVRVNGVVEGEARPDQLLSDVVAQFAWDLNEVNVRLDGQVVSRAMWAARVEQLGVVDIEIESVR